jgi:hypothetical protein
MRCPKCGYITFDQLDTCPSCNKDISKFSKDLLGVTFRTTIPDFLQFGVQEDDEPEEEFDEASAEVEVFDDGGDDTEAEGEEEVEFAVEEEAEEPEDEGIDFDLSDSSETAEQDDADLDLSVDEDDGPDLSLEDNEDDDSGLDLSLDDDDGLDLDLSADDGKNDEELEHSAGSEELEGLDLSLEDMDPEISMETEEKPEKGAPPDALGELDDLGDLDLADLSASSAGDSGSASEELTLEKADDASGRKSQQDDGLPDLEIDGLDFDGPAKPPAGSATGERFKPSAKTGTALDDFDIDLGDL